MGAPEESKFDAKGHIVRETLMYILNDGKAALSR
jgi:hypothetical protein